MEPCGETIRKRIYKPLSAYTPEQRERRRERQRRYYARTGKFNSRYIERMRVCRKRYNSKIAGLEIPKPLPLRPKRIPSVTLERYRIQHRAHAAVLNAIKSGKLIPKPCEVCGVLKADAHHEDYTKKLEVIWLCSLHHNEKHRRSN